MPAGEGIPPIKSTLDIRYCARAAQRSITAASVSICAPWHAKARQSEWGLAIRLDPFEIVPTKPIHADMENPMADTMDRILRIGTVLERTGLSRSTLYRKIREGSFPRQVSISAQCKGWQESAISRWVANPPCFRDQPGDEAA